MRTIRLLLATTLVAATVMAAGVVRAHEGEDVRPNKAGPIHRGKTTLREMRDWFSRPTARKSSRSAASK